MNRGWVALTLVTLLALPAEGGPLTITITAARMEVDAARGSVLAEGEVMVSDGRVSFAGQKLIFDWRLGQGLLIAGRGRIEQGVLEAGRIRFQVSGRRITTVSGLGDASFEVRGSVLFGDRIELAVTQRTLRASGDVRVFVPPDVVAFGRLLTYDMRAERVALVGPIRIQSAAGALTGRSVRIRGPLTRPEIVVSGEVQFDYVDGRGAAAQIRLLPSEYRAVLEEGVFIEQGQQRLWAERVVLFYRERRMVAERVRRILVEEGAEGYRVPVLSGLK